MIFDGMLRNLDNVSGKFLMYPRFIQTFLDKQLDGLPTHKKKYDVSFYTKKVFANMKRIGKRFSGKETPLFSTMVRPNQVQMGEGSTEPIDTQHTPTFDMPPPKPKKTQKPRQTKRKTTKVPQPSRSTDITADEAVHKEEGDSLVWATTTSSSLEAEQDSSNIDKTQTKATSNEPRGYIQTWEDNEIDVDEDIALVSTHDDMVQDEGMEDGEEEVVEVVTTAKMLIDTDTNVEVTQASKRKGVMIQEPEEITTIKTASSQQPQVQDKGKGKAKLIEEPMKLKKKDHILFDEEVARKIQEEIYEQERLVAERARQEEEANSALIETWEDIQTKVDADYQLAERLQAEEQEQLTDAEYAKLFMEFLEKRRKFFAAKRTAKKRNKPPTKLKKGIL
nr:hypothetical protein [Tanacetum cinerariifolium]